MNTIKQNTETWFGIADNSFVDYFNNGFKHNTIKTLKFPASTVNRWDLNNTADYYKLSNSLAQTYIDAIVKMRPILRKVPFSNLLEQDKYELREAVCEAVQNAVLNQQVWQKLSGSNISTTGWTINVDTTPWVITSDMFGLRAWTIISNSTIHEYDIVGEGELYTISQNNNIQVIRKITDLANIPEMVWD